MKPQLLRGLAGGMLSVLILLQAGLRLAAQTPKRLSSPLQASNASTGPTDAGKLDVVDIARAYLSAHQADYGFTDADVADFSVSDQYTDAHNGLTHLYLVQRWKGIEVFNGVFNFNIDQSGRVLFAGNRWIPHLGDSVNTTRPTITARVAVERAATHLQLAIRRPLRALDFSTSANQSTLFSDGGISQDNIPAQLVYDTSGAQPRLAWNIIINAHDGVSWLNMRVDATTGQILSENNWVTSESWRSPSNTNATVTTIPANSIVATLAITPVADGSSYAVYPWPVESPNHITPLPPADGRVTLTQPADALGSPYGWHDINGVAGAEFTTTVGNNVQAYTDVDANNVPDPGSSPTGAGAASLDFVFPINLTQAPSAYRPAAVTNLFYWNNLMHDVQYRYGFTEVAGNFQVNNYGRGGLDSDSVQAEAQDGLTINNANFATPADGTRPRMQMFVWTAANPDRDGDLDNGTMAHEYGHGISNRLTGGPSNVNCLANNEQMGEGWSDWFNLFMTMKAGEDFASGRGVATYTFNQATSGVGLRPVKYSTNMAVNPYTYANLSSMVPPHGVGFIWNTMLYEMAAALVNRYGLNPDLYGAWNTGGNNLANQLIMDGLKIQPCSPGFVDGRNAILAADTALMGGANQCLIWVAFAKRGLGYSAAQGDINNTSDGTAAFDLPSSCNFLVAPPPQAVCQGSNALYPIQVGGAFTAPVTMSVTGNPAPTTALFNLNPVTGVPTTTLLTIGNTGSAAPGAYPLDIHGDSVTTAAVTSTLTIYAGTPAVPTLTSPTNGAVAVSPTFNWMAASGAASYNLQVATDAGFSALVYSTTVTGTSAWASLAGSTTYFWRVRAINPCSLSTYSAVFSVTTAPIFCRTPDLVLASNFVVTDTMPSSTSGALLDLNISISGTHTWVGDLAITVTHGLSNVLIVDRPGYTGSAWGCGNDNFNIELDDEGVDGAVENQCATNPALFGHPTPHNPLSGFDGLDFSGTWTITVRDNLAPNPGLLQQWCLLPTFASSRVYLPLIQK